jgi:surface polysaccharide O-acyltransferase-like enzyme
MKINYLAVVVSAVVYWLLGGLWYGLLFGQRWMALENITVEQGRSMSSALPYIVTFVLNLLIAYTLAQFCSWRNANTTGRGAAIGVMLWVGIVGPITYTTYMYEMRPRELFAINEFFPLVGLCLMGAILGMWKKKTA